MRIGIFSWESLYSIKIGEIAPHVSKLSEALARRGHEMHIFTRRGDFDTYDFINEVHYHRVSFWDSGDIITQMDNMCEALTRNFEIAQRDCGKFDVIHGHDWHPVRALSRIKHDCSPRYILTLHSTEWGRNNYRLGSGISREISHIEWLGGYESDQIIVTKKHMKDEVMQIYSIPETKITVVPNATSMALCINCLFKSPDYNNEKANKCPNLIDAESAWDCIASKTEEVYNGALVRCDKGNVNSTGFNIQN